VTLGAQSGVLTVYRSDIQLPIAGYFSAPVDAMCSLFGDIPNDFSKGLDCILSKLRLTRPSKLTDTRSVVETLPYSVTRT